MNFYKIIVILCLMAASVSAEESYVTPRAGFIGSAPLIGIQGGMDYDFIALEVSGGIASSQVGSLYPIELRLVFPFERQHVISPYGVLSGGLLFTSPDDAVAGETIQSALLNFGGGLNWRFHSQLHFVFELNQMATIINNASTQRDEIFVIQGLHLGVKYFFGEESDD